MLLNNSSYLIHCQESDRPADAWINVSPESCSPLWPKSEQEDKLIKLKIDGTDEVSAPFLISESHVTLLRLDNKVSALVFAIKL